MAPGDNGMNCAGCRRAGRATELARRRGLDPNAWQRCRRPSRAPIRCKTRPYPGERICDHRYEASCWLHARSLSDTVTCFAGRCATCRKNGKIPTVTYSSERSASRRGLSYHSASKLVRHERGKALRLVAPRYGGSEGGRAGLPCHRSPLNRVLSASLAAPLCVGTPPRSRGAGLLCQAGDEARCHFMTLHLNPSR